MLNATLRDAVRAMTNDELNELVALVQARRTVLNATASMQFRVGDRVSFVGKRGYRVEGTIDRVVRGSHKFDLVNCTDGMRWRCPANMLTLVPSKTVK